MTDFANNYSAQPVKTRIVLWSNLIMFLSLIANLILTIIIIGGYWKWEGWLKLSLAFSTVFVLASITLVVSIIIRLVERANRKAPKSGR